MEEIRFVHVSSKKVVQCGCFLRQKTEDRPIGPTQRCSRKDLNFRSEKWRAVQRQGAISKLLYHRDRRGSIPIHFRQFASREKEPKEPPNREELTPTSPARLGGQKRPACPCHQDQQAKVKILAMAQKLIPGRDILREEKGNELDCCPDQEQETQSIRYSGQKCTCASASCARDPTAIQVLTRTQCYAPDRPRYQLPRVDMSN